MNKRKLTESIKGLPFNPRDRKTFIEEVSKGGGATGSIKITYKDLKELRDTQKLIPGTYYRIIDYETKVNVYNAKSAGHLFDILVLAIDTNAISKYAYATHTDRDTYFNDRKLDSWYLEYCLDNDKTKFE